MGTKKCGYSYWGFLGDTKMDKDGNLLSTPDGNAFYSWSIIRQLQKDGYVVVQVMPDRDKDGFDYTMKTEKSYFDWAVTDKCTAYAEMQKNMYNELILEKEWYEVTSEMLFNIWDMYGLNDCEFILHEWRMRIPGRNDEQSRGKGWQPDYFIQNCLIEYCRTRGVKLIIFDLDYKIDIIDFIGMYGTGVDISIVELGNKWQCFETGSDMKGRRFGKVYIPFDWDHIDDFAINPMPVDDMVYVGNRYERDWCIDKYIPNCKGRRITVYGNWNEGGRDSKTRWPGIHFGKRIQTSDMRFVYSNSLVTILLAKKEYCKYSFMTARIIEAIFYGTVPLFIAEYGADTIKEYAGRYAPLLTVYNSNEVLQRIDYFRNNLKERYTIIEYLRRRLRFMDVKNFTKILYEMK